MAERKLSPVQKAAYIVAEALLVVAGTKTLIDGTLPPTTLQNHGVSSCNSAVGQYPETLNGIANALEDADRNPELSCRRGE